MLSGRVRAGRWWCAASRVWAKLATDSGGWRAINRCGQPFMVLLYPGSADEYNQSAPADNLASDGDRIAKMVASVVAAHGTAEDPEAYGQAIAELLLPDILPYRIGTPASFGFAGRNGRTLTDNFYVEGTVTGPKVNGAIKGVDYINVRADEKASAPSGGWHPTARGWGNVLVRRRPVRGPLGWP